MVTRVSDKHGEARIGAKPKAGYNYRSNRDRQWDKRYNDRFNDQINQVGWDTDNSSNSSMDGKPMTIDRNCRYNERVHSDDRRQRQPVTGKSQRKKEDNRHGVPDTTSRGKQNTNNIYSSSDDKIPQSKGKKSGINAKLTSNVQVQLTYPHYSLGQLSGFIGQNIQYHQLSFEQFMAGELSTIDTCQDIIEKIGRMQLLKRVALWRLRVNVTWPQIRNAFAHILRRIENKEVTWESDWDTFEQHIYDKIANTVKNEKSKKSNIAESVWFCKAYQRQEGCAKDSPHLAKIGANFRQVQHICASCWLKEKQRKLHPECSVDCPSKEA